MFAAPERVNRWALSDGAVEFPVGGAPTSATSTNGASAGVSTFDGLAHIDAEGMAKLCDGLGEFTVECGGVSVQFERVGSRYTDRATIIAAGRNTNDGFQDESRFPPSAFSDAIQAAEEAIDRACGRSFCKRRRRVTLWPGRISELPFVDAYAIECDDPGVRLVSYCQAIGVSEPTQAIVEFGVSLDAQMRAAATKLAASYLRPRAAAENARGTAVDGVYISYDLATGEDGGWTGIPFVDAAIEQHRARRGLIA